MRKLQHSFLYLVIVLVLFSCEAQDIPESFAIVDVEPTYEFTLADEEGQLIPGKATIECVATDDPEYGGSLSDFEDEAIWSMTLIQKSVKDDIDDQKFSLGVRDGLSTTYVQDVEILQGDTVIFELLGKFQVKISEDVTKIYLSERTDTVIVK